MLTLWPPAGPRELCSSTPGRHRPHARACKLPTTGLSRTFLEWGPTHRPGEDQHLFFGKIPVGWVPTASARPQQHFWAALAVPKLYRKSALCGAKMVQDTLRSLKAIWHFVRFNPIPHILPVLSKLRCPTNLATLPCLPLQNRISFQREMCPSKICSFLASNYGNIFFHLLYLSVRAFSLPCRIVLIGHSVLHPDLLQKDLPAMEFPQLSLLEAESPSRKWIQFGKLIFTHCWDKISIFYNSDEKVVSWG